MEICGLDISVARRDFTATRSAPLRDYAGLAVLFNTTVAAFLFSRNVAPSRDNRHAYRILSDWTIIRQPDCVFHKSKQVVAPTKLKRKDP
jgi:hypothetical protein